jgi:TetR/AcrR family transcriptional regulator, cholesterol catabolism regulator
LLRLGLEERKDFISKIATEVFGEKGYRASSIQDVAQRANISKAGIYHYFKSKEEILANILIKNSDNFLDKLRNRVKQSEDQGLSPEESFKKLIETYANHINSDKNRRLVVLRDRHQLSGKYKKELFRKEEAIFRLIRKELRKIQNLDENINQNTITFLLISMSHWLGYWFREEKSLSLEDLIDQNIKVVFHGMLKK